MSKEPTITHQAIELHPHGCGLNVTRCWSKWTDGTITHSDSETTTRETEYGIMFGSQFVNIGMDMHLLPPPGVKWIDTAQPRETDSWHEVGRLRKDAERFAGKGDMLAAAMQDKKASDMRDRLTAAEREADKS